MIKINLSNLCFSLPVRFWCCGACCGGGVVLGVGGLEGVVVIVFLRGLSVLQIYTASLLIFLHLFLENIPNRVFASVVDRVHFPPYFSCSLGHQ